MPKDIEKLYNKWKGFSKLFLMHGGRRWEVVVHWVEDRCMFGKGWYEFANEFGICEGDVVAMDMTEDPPEEVFICVFKKENVTREREASNIYYFCGLV